ncbi:Uncharacterized protein APZ42_025862 [Daphnia magna]|uniref:Neurexin IV n=1 Tax=Daphnia magna TaxID=35525 RepID=A0A164SNT7_9CRUS|nr:Uncharacterized protein APZ42_025862 [Daphnia magna]
MACMESNTARHLTVSWPFSNRHCSASIWLITLALLVTKPLLSSTNPIADGSSEVTNMNMVVVSSYFDRLFEDIKGLVKAVNDETNVKAIVATPAEELKRTPRNRRSLFEDFPFETSKSCSLTESELKHINELLQSISNDEVSHNPSCEIKEVEPAIVSMAGSSEHCNQLIESIVMNVNDVKNAFWCLSKTPTAITDRYEELRAAYDRKVRQLELRLDNAEKKFDQKFKMEIDKLMTSYHEVEKKLRATLDELQKVRLAHSLDTIKLVVEYLVNGNIQSAWEKFKSISMGTSVIKAIVQRAISKEFSANVPIINVIKFTGGLKDNVDAMVHGVVCLFDELEKRQTFDLEIVKVLYVTIEDVVKTCIDLEGTESEESRLTLDDDTIDQLILVKNKIAFLKYING